MSVQFGDRIRQARKAANMTQKELARRLGVSNTTVSNWEKDLSRPDADKLQELCALLGLEPNDVYGTGSRTVTDDDIKFALFGGSGEITDAMYEEVRRFAAFLKEREKHKE